MEGPTQLLQSPGAGPDVLLGLDHLHDLQHKLKIVVVEAAASSAASAAASASAIRIEHLGPFAQLLGPLLGLDDGLVGLVGGDQLAIVVQGGVDMGLLHGEEQLLVNLLLGPGIKMPQVFLYPADVRGGAALLHGEFPDHPLVGRIEVLDAAADQAVHRVHEGGRDAILLGGRPAQPVDEGAGLEIAVRFVSLFDGLAHLFEDLFLLFNGLLKVLFGLLGGRARILGLVEILLDLRHVLIAEFLHVLHRLRHLLHGLLVDFAVAQGFGEQLLHALGKFLHFVDILRLFIFLLLQPFLVGVFLQFFGVFALEAAILVEVVLLAPGRVFQFADDAVKLLFEELGVFVGGENEENDGFGVDSSAVGEIVLHIGPESQFLRLDAEGGGSEGDLL